MPAENDSAAPRGGAMDGKACIVTGGAGSLGLHAARALLQEGAHVQLVDRSATLLAPAAAALSEFSGRVTTFVADVSDAGQTQDYVAAAVERWGGIDFLFCNAGIDGPVAPIEHYQVDQFDTVMAVNVRGTFLACKYGLPAMRDGGSVLITSSIVGVTAAQGICAYATSKHALIGLMRVAAKEMAPRNVRVNAIAPGPIDNDFQADVEARIGVAIGLDATELLNGMIPLGRHGRPDEVARMVLFLASDQSSFSTGGVFMADGGMHV